MTRNFRIVAEIEPINLPFGSLRQMSHPPSTGARQITAMDAVIRPGEGHSFHKHPDQEEVIYVVRGKARMRWGERLE